MIRIGKEYTAMEPQRPVEEGSSGELEIAAEADLRQEAPPDARGLVGQMVAAGEWPEPTLVEQILAAGDAAVEPLREVLKTRPLGWPAEAPIVHAAGILGMLRPPSACPISSSSPGFTRMRPARWRAMRSRRMALKALTLSWN